VRLSADSGEDYYQWWEAAVHNPWSSTDVVWSFPAMWWDQEACARQLPYHRILMPVAYNDPVGIWCGSQPNTVTMEVVGCSRPSYCLEYLLYG
jgi:hypothetical protein